MTDSVVPSTENSSNSEEIESLDETGSNELGLTVSECDETGTLTEECSFTEDLLKSCNSSEQFNLTDEEKARLAELMSDVGNVLDDATSKNFFSISGEDKSRWESIDRKLKILAQRYGMEDEVASSEDGCSGEGETEWTDYVNSSQLQEIEKQLEELRASGGNETSGYKNNNV